MSRNVKMWYAKCTSAKYPYHIPLFANRPANKDHCQGCGTKVELHDIGEGYVSQDEADMRLAKSTPLSKPESN
jgi:hypothetical protein